MGSKGQFLRFCSDYQFGGNVIIGPILRFLKYQFYSDLVHPTPSKFLKIVDEKYIKKNPCNFVIIFNRFGWRDHITND